MSDNPNVIYIFVKGFKGKFAYEITDHNFKTLHKVKNKNSLNDNKEKSSPIRSDINAMVECLEFVKGNRGMNGIPENPVSFLFTTYENNFLIANKLKQPDKFRDSIKQIDKIKERLARSVYDKDQVKIYWVPKGFKNKMDEVEAFLNSEPPSKFTP